MATQSPNLPWTRLKLDEAVVNNPLNTAYKKTTLGDFCPDEKYEIEMVKCAFSAEVECVENCSEKNTKHDLEAEVQEILNVRLQATPNALGHRGIRMSPTDVTAVVDAKAVSCVLLPKNTTVDAGTQPWMRGTPLQDGDLVYVTDRSSGFMCTLPIFLVEGSTLENKVALCGPAAKNFVHGSEVAFLATCLGSFLHTKNEVEILEKTGALCGPLVCNFVRGVCDEMPTLDSFCVVGLTGAAQQDHPGIYTVAFDQDGHMIGNLDTLAWVAKSRSATPDTMNCVALENAVKHSSGATTMTKAPG